MNFHQHRLLIESDEITDATEFRVLVALCSFADPVEAKCWAGKEKIARAARLATDESGNSRAADGAIKRLIKDGHISLAETGGGARRPNCYQIHIGGQKSSRSEASTPHEERGFEVEGENPNPAFDDTNPAANAGFAPLTPHLDTFPKAVTPHLNTSHIRSEESKKRNEELDDDEESRRRRSSSSSSGEPHLQNHAREAEGETDPTVLDFRYPDALTLSLCEACALMPDALGERHRGQLRAVTVWLLEIYPNRETAAREVAVRFGAKNGVWDKPSPPHLPQIKTDWKRMERILDFQKQAQNSSPNGVSNHADHQFNQQQFRPSSAAQRRESAWASAIENVMD
ncbi:MAG: hypothetical protein KY445_00915 [Armatimonadetes bacterium]|nr:hypothetical protein [Armatimonadota bacterium]